jgi:hypothetical protein
LDNIRLPPGSPLPNLFPGIFSVFSPGLKLDSGVQVNLTSPHPGAEEAQKYPQMWYICAEICSSFEQLNKGKQALMV